MRDSYVNNVEEILSANESQRNKIEFLQRQRVKRDHYLSDLQENLSLNKETLKQYNLMGSNEKAIERLLKQTDVLTNKLKVYYEDYQNINALLLMEQQMRLEDKQFYQERIIQFQNKLVDLRKYLHDKEESFTSVIARLRRYEEVSQLPMEEKLQAYKKEIGQRSTNEFVADLIKQKNFYKSQYEKMKKDYIVFSDMKYAIINKFEGVEAMLQNFEKQNAVSIKMLVGNIYQKMEEDKKVNKRMEPPRQLIRLLKKEKLNNQLLEEALNDAIEKNEELIALKDIFEKNVHRLETKCRLLYSENTIFALKLAEYDHHFCRRYSHNKKYYEEGQIKGLGFIINDRLKEYAKNILQYYENNAKLFQQYNQKLKSDVDQWSRFMCDSHFNKDSFTRQNILVKSCSTPKLVVGFDFEEVEGDKLIVEEF